MGTILTSNKLQYNNCWAAYACISEEGGTMTATIIQFMALLLVALLVGAMFGILIGFNPADLSPGVYVEQQQHAIRALNTFMPLLGAVCIVLTIVLAILSKEDRAARYLLLAAAACLIVTGVVTRFGNQPINSVVMTWAPQTLPSNWAKLRDQWWQWHIVRTVSGIAALCFLIWAVLLQHNPSR